MIAFLLVAVAFSIQQTEKAVGERGGTEEERVGYGAVKTQGWNVNSLRMCVGEEDESACRNTPECDWSLKCSGGCGFKKLNTDCSGITISKCLEMGYFGAECFNFGCECDWSSEQCVKEGYPEDYCLEHGCDKEERVGYGAVKTQGWKVNSLRMCIGEEDESACRNTPECDWFTNHCKNTCDYKNLRNDCSGITLSKCKEMGYIESQCLEFGCQCDMSLEQCTNEGYSEGYCKRFGCGTCTCDHRGRMAYEGGDWCYLSSAPCTLLDGYEADATWTWAECEWNGQKQVDCGESEKAVASPRAAVDTEESVGFSNWCARRCGSDRSTNGPYGCDCSQCGVSKPCSSLDESLAMSKSSHSVGPSKVVQALALVGFLTSLYGAACHFLKN